MKKFLLGAMLLAMAVSVAGCDLYGTVKNVKTTYTVADYAGHKLVKKTISSVATDTDNVLLSITTDGPDGHYMVLTPAESSYGISSNSAGIWLGNIEGLVVDPEEGNDTKFATNAICTGVVRVSGTGIYNISDGSFSGDGQFISIPIASMDVTGAGKWTATSETTSVYKGVAKITITPGIAMLVTVSGGVVTGPPVPVKATITTSGVALNATLAFI